MLHDPDLRLSGMRRGRYRPPRAWLGRPGDGVPIRPRHSSGLRWSFRWRQLRILLLACALGALAWSQMPDGAAPVAGRAAAR
ncbi:MAG: hypothetical protein WDN24_10735 [Sphingomonas sp.]